MHRYMMFFRVMVVIGVTDLVVTAIFQFLQIPQGLGTALADGGLLVVLCAPPLYFWVVRGMGEALADEHLRDFMETAPDLVQSVNPQGRFLFVNHAWLETLGYAREEVPSLSMLDIIHPDHRKACQIIFQRILRGETVENIETVFITKDGRSVTVSGNINCRFKDEKPLATRGIFRNITDRKRAEAAIVASEQRYADLFENAQDAILTNDLSGRFTAANRAAERLTGYTREEMANMTAPQLVSPGLADFALKEVARLSAGGARPATWEWEIVTKDGRRVPVEVSTRTIYDGDTPVGIQAIARDITKRKRAEQELQNAKDAADVANRAKSEFLANMSHEIRTPINGIIGMTDLALDTNLTSEQREFLGMVRESADSLLTIINDILDFSRIEAGKFALDVIEFDLDDCLANIAKTFAPQAHGKGLELAYQVHPGVPRALLGDPSRLRQIIVNLIGNAIKFTEHGEVVLRVDTEECGDAGVRLHFAVSDTGTGIPREKQEVIFDAFTQADSSMTRRYGGTGLGLKIATNLVKMMEGRLWVESDPGQGSTFHFTARFGVQAAIRRSEPRKAVNLKGMPVLVVDDNSTNRRILDAMLRRWMMIPSLAKSGDDALVLLDENAAIGKSFPLILIDAQMPGMDGFTLAERIKQNPESAAATVMMLTSTGQRGDAARCRELGISAYLIKPIRQSELLDAILTALGERHAGDRPRLVTRHLLRETRQKLRILLAEDNPVNRELAVRLLEKRGHQVIVAQNGMQTIAALETQPFDLVLMDVQMPGMDGFQATAAIREKEKAAGSHLRIIAMTAHAMKGDKERCLAAGMDGYVSKPIEAKELFEMIEGTVAVPVVKNQASEESIASPVNWDEALARVEGDHQLLADMAKLFLDDGPKLFSDVRSAIAGHDSKALERAAHALKSSTGNFSAHPAYEATLQLEKIGRDGDLARAEEACRLLDQELARLWPVLEAIAMRRINA